MAFRFIHTADWQIGKVFKHVDDAALSGALQTARLEAVTRIGDLAAKHGVAHVLVAGDVWEYPDAEQRLLRQTLERMQSHPSVQWHLLPGNHDAHQPKGLWDRLRPDLPVNVYAHTAPEVAVIEQGAVALLPAPLTHRKSMSDLTEWMDDAQTEPGQIRIGLAHGSVAGFSSDEEQHANPIAPSRPESARLDYLALGDWHGAREINSRVHYSGTPETDRFDTTGTGTALLVEIDVPGATPRVTQLDTGQYTWMSETATVRNQSDIDRLDQRLRSPDSRPERTLVSLKVDGVLSLEDQAYFNRNIKENALLAHLNVDDNSLVTLPTDEDLDAIDVGGIVRIAADRLRAISEAGGDDGALAQEALLRLYVEHKRLETVHT